ncbi:MAG: anaerobic sulfatase-maturation protein [Candidatus Methylacidiphilales bacterium]
MSTRTDRKPKQKKSLPFHIMTKPIGPLCNLDCKYCFYLEKEKLFPSNEDFKMRDDVLETYIRNYIRSQNTPEVSFAWQGGEPTLLGLEYFKRIVQLQNRHRGAKTIHNALQTNGTLLDDDWCAFLTKNRFLVGLSIDGPSALHDAYRVDKKQRPTFDRVMHGLSLLKKHGTEFNTLTVVNAVNVKQPLEVYRFLKEIGSGFIQFIPLVERVADDAARSIHLDLAAPSGTGLATSPVTSWSVPAESYGEFLCSIFDEWVRHDVGHVFVQLFDVTLGNWIGAGSGLCVFSETCGSALAMEHNGDVYSCDHYVYPEYRLGNLMNQSLGSMANSDQQLKFGLDKKDSLPRYCRECEVRFACHGECPKHRFIRTPDGEPGLNYLCAAYKTFFNHVTTPMNLMTGLLRQQRPPSLIMNLMKQQG